MSVEALGYVFSHSPYKGTARVIHLAIADSVSDQNDYEFWMRQGKLAEKANCHRQLVNKTIQQMVEDGYLRLIGQSPGGTNRYEFLMPEGVSGIREGVSNQDRVVSNQDRGVSAIKTGGVLITDTEPKVTQLVTQRDSITARSDFDEFWKAYPRKKGRGQAEKAWAKAIKIASPAEIIEGARVYASSPDRDPKFTRWPSTWLNGKGWLDEPTPLEIPKKYAAQMRFAARSREVAQ